MPKTAADSALAAKFLSREDSKVLLVIGAGPIAQALAHAYLHINRPWKKSFCGTVHHRN
ncbi:hypothetical protein [Pantoea sp. A4]|uniref:hypothetical protein n=1 Tax=Pantoea sp. A4 TaxID=1225184 RepID=UPI003FCE7BDB